MAADKDVGTTRNAPTPSHPDNPIDQFTAFVELVRILRVECPWDRKQTHQSISHLLVEEVYEALEALEHKDFDGFSAELGDILLHIVMHAVIAEERGAFSLAQLIDRIRTKLIERHPHVFGSASVSDASDVSRNWEQLKMKEGRTSVLDGVPKSLPALLRAQRIQEKAANVGFDWDNSADVWNKVEEEFGELQAELQNGARDSQTEEFGDALFALINAGRHAGMVGEESLQRANDKFMRRFQYIERKAAAQGAQVKQLTLEQMDALWNEAKSMENRSDGDNSH